MSDGAGAGGGHASALKGVLLVMLSVVSFAMGDILTKYLTTRHDVPLVLAVRYVVNLTLLVAVFAPTQGRSLVRVQRRGLVLVRAACLVGASLAMGFALRVMPVGETVAIVYLSPFMVMLLAVPLLGEKIGLPGWLAAAAGFAGILLIVRPGGGLDPGGVALALLTAAGSAVYALLSRVLSRTETTGALLVSMAGFGAVTFCAMLPFGWDGRLPGLADAALMVALGGLTALGHVLFTVAHRLAPASALAPVSYLQLVWVGLLGWLVFGHVPDAVTITGMALVVTAGIAVALRTRGGSWRERT
jgi:drug/metabolite transporter (DMT)-like permease